MKKFNKKQMKILEDYFDVHEDDTTIELESWTNGGVDMIIYINKKDHFGNDYLTQLKEFADNFDIDAEIDIHRQSERYCNDFTIKESVEDFTSYINDIKSIIKDMEGSKKGKQDSEYKTTNTLKNKLHLLDIATTGMSWEELQEQYDNNITITICGETLQIPFDAVSYNEIIRAVENIIKEQ